MGTEGKGGVNFEELYADAFSWKPTQDGPESNALEELKQT